jgi:holo-[acyl-carrier protein] synthase
LIIGTGTDLANIDRINKVLLRYGDRFRNRVFTKNEQAKAKKRKDEAGTLAKRWAAKEACSKALGTGLRMGISWKDMAVSNIDTGQPVMTLTGWAKKAPFGINSRRILINSSRFTYRRSSMGTRYCDNRCTAFSLTQSHQ